MKNKVFEINVDFETKSAVDSDLIKIVKGDYNSIEFDLKMDKTDYKRAVLFLVKPSKKNFVVDIANSKAIFTEKNTFDEVGIYYYGIVLYGTNSKLTTSTKGKIQVVEGYNEDNEDITGDENYPILDKLIEEVTDLKDKINASLGVMNKTFKEVTYDPSTGVMSFKNLNNEVTNINLPLSLLISSASYDNDNKKIVLTLANNDTIDIPILDLVSNYYDDKINANKEYIASTSNELYRLKTDVLETGESSGDNIHLEDSALSEVQEISVDGVCEQNTTMGKNSLDYDNLTNIGQLTKINPYGFRITGTNAWMSRNFTIDLKANTKYTFKCLFNQTDEMSTIEVSIREENGKIIKDLISSNKNGTLIGSFTTEAVTKITFHLYSNLSATPMTTTCDFTFLQIVEGEYTDETMPDFEPYTGNQPSPSPNFPQNISVLTGNIKLTSCRKNLIPLNSFFNNNDFILTNDLVTQKNKVSASWAWTYDKAIFKFKILKGTYTLTYFADILSTNYSAQFRIIDINNNEVASSEVKQKFDKGSISFTIDKDLEIGIVAKIYDGAWRFQLEKGSTATEYEPYQDSSLNITIPSNEFVGKINDTNKDTLKVVYKDDGHYHLMLNKMVGKIILNDYTNISTYIFNSMNGIQFKNVLTENQDCANGLSNYSSIVGKRYVESTIWVGVNSKDVFWLGILDLLNISTIDEFKNWLLNNTVIVYYVLKTPYEIDLGIVDTLLTFDEITNIFTDSDLYPVINVKYYRNFIKTIQNLQVNNDTLKNELSNIESRLAALENANTSEIDNNPSDDTQESEVTE